LAGGVDPAKEEGRGKNAICEVVITVDRGENFDIWLYVFFGGEGRVILERQVVRLMFCKRVGDREEMGVFEDRGRGSLRSE